MPRGCFRASRTYGWTPATGARNKGRGWVEKVLGWTVDLVENVRVNLRSGGGPEAVGRRVGQGRREGRLAEADAAQRVLCPAPPLGGGADVFLDRSQQEDEPMDYERLTETSEAFIY